MHSPLDPALLARESDAIRRLARAILVDAQRADDAAQETMRIALERGPREGISPAPWLRGVLRNVVRRMRRTDARRVARERAAAMPLRAPEVDSGERLTRRKAVFDAVLVLPEALRTAIELRFFEGLPPRSMARRLGIPVETCRSRVRRGLEGLRVEMDRREGGDGRRWALCLAPIAFPSRGPEGGGGWGGALMGMKAKGAAVGVVAALLAGAAYGIWPNRPEDGGGTGSPPSLVAPDAAGGLASRPAGEPASPTTLASGAAESSGGGSPRVDGDRALLISGRIVSALGKPEGGAIIALRVTGDSQRAIVTSTEAGATGYFELRAAGRVLYDVVARTAGQPARVAIRGSVSAPSELFLTIPGGSAVLTIELKGRETQESCEAALYWVDASRMERVAIAKFEPGVRLGEVSGLRSGRYFVLVQGAGVVGKASVVIGSYPSARVDVILTQSLRGTGVVLDDVTKQPIAGCGLIVREERIGTSDEHGEFGIDVAERDVTAVIFMTPGYEPRGEPFTGEEQGKKVYLAKSKVVSVICRAPDGRSYTDLSATKVDARAETRLHPKGPSEPPRLALCDPDGRVEFDGLRAGASYALSVVNEPLGLLGEGRLAAGEVSATVTLRDGLKLAGWVADAAGRGIPGAEVLVVGLAENPLGAPIEDAPIRPAPTARPVEPRWMATSGVDGRFEVLVSDKTPFLEARASHDDYAASMPVYVEGKSAALRLVMRTGRQVGGIVLDRKGVPQRAVVYLRGTNDPRFDAPESCDERRRFTFHRVPEGAGVSVVASFGASYGRPMPVEASGSATLNLPLDYEMNVSGAARVDPRVGR